MQEEVVFVGLSGGVDSSVAALRLKREGKRVVGVFIKTWHPDFIACNEEAERLDAMRIAAHLDIPFLTCDAEDAYKSDVAEYMIREYTAGRTPNPDVMCNKHVKFGAFLEFALAHGADKIATGHYAQVSQMDGAPTLLRGADAQKDQSYFLWTLTKEQLARTYFPVGNTKKSAIRAEAAAAGLLTHRKKDSQGICFLGDIDIPSFLAHYTELKEGDVLSTEGDVIGTHRGALVYTLGQRHGFVIFNNSTHSTPHFVIERDVAKNTITVATEPPSIQKDSVIYLTDLVLRSQITPETPLTAQFRYRQTPHEVRLTVTADSCGMLTVLKSVDQPSPGQSCVLYDGDVCIGGGIIANNVCS